MDRFFVIALLTVQLALWPGCGEGENARPVFFSLLFPQLMPGHEHAPGCENWPFCLFEDAAEEAIRL